VKARPGRRPGESAEVRRSDGGSTPHNRRLMPATDHAAIQFMTLTSVSF
jgi:hypothetical protein